MEYIFNALSSPGPIIINLGIFSLRWYGLLIAISVITGLNLTSNLASYKGIDKNKINDLLPLLILSSLIGARIYYVLFEWRSYKYNPIETLEIWKGGIAIHGALIGSLIAIWIFCIVQKLYFWNLLDILVPSFALGQGIGRWGNFFNNEAFGLPTDLPWKIYIPINSRPIELSNFDYFHPTFLYESIWNFLIFAILITLIRRKQKNKLELPNGALSCIYLISYSFGRIWIEGLRIDPLCLGALPPFCQGGIRIAQLVSIVLITIGIFSLLWLYKYKRNLPSFGTIQEL